MLPKTTKYLIIQHTSSAAGWLNRLYRLSVSHSVIQWIDIAFNLLSRGLGIMLCLSKLPGMVSPFGSLWTCWCRAALAVTHISVDSRLPCRPPYPLFPCPTLSRAWVHSHRHSRDELDYYGRPSICIQTWLVSKIYDLYYSICDVFSSSVTNYITLKTLFQWIYYYGFNCSASHPKVTQSLGRHFVLSLSFQQLDSICNTMHLRSCDFYYL